MKPTSAKKRRYGWIVIPAVAGAVLVGGILAASIWLVQAATKAHRLPVTVRPESWNLRYEEVSFPSQNPALTLRGWYLPARGAEAALAVVHGVHANRVDTSVGQMRLIAMLVGHGYSVLAFDLRAHGESDGRRISGGYYEKWDVLAAVDFLRARGFRSVGVLGFSLGAAACLLAAADDGSIRAVVADSSFADLEAMVKKEYLHWTGLPPFLLRPLLLVPRLIYGFDMGDVSPAKSMLLLADRPVLLIHGELDGVIPVGHAYRLLNSSPSPRHQLWVAPQCGHVQAFRRCPQEYLQRVTEFLDSALLQAE